MQVTQTRCSYDRSRPGTHAVHTAIVPQTRYSYDRSRPGTWDPRCPRCHRPALGPRAPPGTTRHFTGRRGPLETRSTVDPVAMGSTPCTAEGLFLLFCCCWWFVCCCCCCCCFACCCFFVLFCGCFSPFFRSAKATSYCCLCGAALGSELTLVQSGWPCPPSDRRGLTPSGTEAHR